MECGTVITLTTTEIKRGLHRAKSRRSMTNSRRQRLVDLRIKYSTPCRYHFLTVARLSCALTVGGQQVDIAFFGPVEAMTIITTQRAWR